jgi:hypothetical protein
MTNNICPRALHGLLCGLRYANYTDIISLLAVGVANKLDPSAGMVVKQVEHAPKYIIGRRWRLKLQPDNYQLRPLVTQSIQPCSFCAL